jgi:hypothetical protein
MSSKEILAEQFQDAVEEALREYGDLVYEATEEGLGEAEKILKANLKANTPRGDTGDFAKGWRGSGKKYKLKRFVGNTKTVPGNGKYGEEISLADIFEYSTTRGKPFIKKTFEDSIDEMAEAVVRKIKGD